VIDEALARELLERYGSPLYAYDALEVERRASELVAALPEGAVLFYSLKANPLPAVVRLLGRRGLGAEVSSSGELGVALDAGIPPDRMLYSGPARTGADIEHALAHGVTVFSCESTTELERLRQAARAARSRVRVLLRLNPASGSAAGLAMSGISSQFGMDEEELGRLLRAGRDEWADPIGLHVYFGTQMRDAATIADACVAVLAAADRLAEHAGRAFQMVDFGGGFPWPFARDDAPPSLAGLRDALDSALSSAAFRGAAWFESGRYLCASAGTLLTTVLDVKQSRGRRYVVVDAGINHVGGMTGLGRIHRPRIDVTPVRPHSPSRLGADVVGPLCTPLDVLARDLPIGDVHPGDVLAVPHVGAYGATASLVSFLSRDPAAEVLHRRGRVEAAFRLRGGHAPLAPRAVLEPCEVT
jgi:diaminopimelate decarboxylase